MNSLENLIKLGNSLGIYIDVLDKVITFSPIEYPKLNLLVITKERTPNTFRIKQHRTAELTREYHFRKVNLEWIHGFIHNYSKIKESIIDAYEIQHLAIKNEQAQSKKRRQEQDIRNQLAKKRMEEQAKESKSRGPGKSPSSFEDRIYDKYR